MLCLARVFVSLLGGESESLLNNASACLCNLLIPLGNHERCSSENTGTNTVKHITAGCLGDSPQTWRAEISVNTSFFLTTHQRGATLSLNAWIDKLVFLGRQGVIKFRPVVDNDTTVHAVHTYTVAFSPSVPIKCSICPYHQTLTRTP